MSLLKLIETDYFLGCFTLKTGSTIIGIYHIIAGLFFTVLEFYVAVQSYRLKLRYYGSEGEFQLVYSFSTAASIQLVFGIYFLWGAIKANQTYVMSGLILSANQFIMTFTMLAFPLARWAIYGLEPHPAVLLEELFSIVLSVYFMIVVYNFYRQLRGITTTNSDDLLNSRALGVEVETY